MQSGIMKMINQIGRLSLVLLFSLLGTGCWRSQAQGGGTEPPPPEVLVSFPVTRTITDYEDFPGRTDAVHFIQVRARVTGYVDKVNFKEGAVLFEIDPRPYEAELKRSEANVVQAQAHLERLNLDYNRGMNLRPKGAIGQEEFDRIKGERAEASAAVGVAQAIRDMAKLN